jgi:hypothetical protein
MVFGGGKVWLVASHGKRVFDRRKGISWFRVLVCVTSGVQHYILTAKIDETSMYSFEQTNSILFISASDCDIDLLIGEMLLALDCYSD